MDGIYQAAKEPFELKIDVLEVRKMGKYKDIRIRASFIWAKLRWLDDLDNS